jgi:hypothetical protein
MVAGSRESLARAARTGLFQTSIQYISCSSPFSPLQAGGTPIMQDQFSMAFDLFGLSSQSPKRKKNAFGSNKGGKLYKDVPY